MIIAAGCGFDFWLSHSDTPTPCPAGSRLGCSALDLPSTVSAVCVAIQTVACRLAIFPSLAPPPNLKARQTVLCVGDVSPGQLVEDIEYRQEQVKKVGLGFELPPRLFELRGLQIVENIAAA